jgi:hypothetical protein
MKKKDDVSNSKDDPPAKAGTSAGIFKQTMGARNRVGIGYTALRDGSLESILGLLQSLKIGAQSPCL